MLRSQSRRPIRYRKRQSARKLPAVLPPWDPQRAWPGGPHLGEIAALAEAAQAQAQEAAVESARRKRVALLLLLK